MPSGSRQSGGSGNHGGFSSSRSSFGSSGSRSGSYSYRPRGPRYFHFGGRTLIITTGRQNIISVLSMLIVFALIAVIACFTIRPSLKQEIAMVEEEYRFYQAMITKAESNSDYIWQAEVTDQEYSQEYEKYCVYYEFKTSNGRTTVDGYTFYVYTLDNIPSVGEVIQIAVDKNPVDSETDSIPMDYKLTTLQDDGYYNHLKKNLRNTTIFLILAIVVVVGIVGGIIAIIFTSKKKEEEKKEEEKQQAILEEKKKYCEYCGTKIQETDTTCPNCGSRLDGRIG